MKKVILSVFLLIFFTMVSAESKTLTLGEERKIEKVSSKSEVIEIKHRGIVLEDEKFRLAIINKLISLGHQFDPYNLKQEDLNKIKILHLLEVEKLDGLEKLVNLKDLAVSNAQINNLKGIDFPDSLNRISISNTQINSLKGIDFPDSLKDLFIVNCRIKSLNDVNFPDSLMSLDLSNNRIKTLNDVNFPDSLTTLSLSNNRITNLDGADFTVLQNLVSLNLDNNRITNLNGLDLTGLRNLLWINLDHNKLHTETFTVERFFKLHNHLMFISINNNPVVNHSDYFNLKSTILNNYSRVKISPFN